MIIEHSGFKFFKTQQDNTTIKDKILDDISKEFVPDFNIPSYGWTVEDFQSMYSNTINIFLDEYGIEGDITKRQIHYTRYAKGVAQDWIQGTDTMFQGSGFQLVHFAKLNQGHPDHIWNVKNPNTNDFKPDLVEGDIIIYPNQEISCSSAVNNIDEEKIVVYYNFNITRL